MPMSAAGLSIEPSLAPAAYDVVHAALEGERCVILDGGTAGGRARVSADALALHRRYVRAGCDAVTADTRGLLSTAPAGGRHRGWPELARRGVGLVRRAVAQERREGEVAVAFSIDAEIDSPDGAETIGLLARALEDEPPDLLVVEGLAVVGPTLHATVQELMAIGLPVWLSFRRCRHGLCGVYGQHWGGPEGDAFGRAARRFEEMGVAARLINCIPPDHVAGMVSSLRDFTDLPLGVYPNLGYYSDRGWRFTPGVGGEEYAEMALRWRGEGAQIVGGCCGVRPEHIVAAAQRLRGTLPGHERPADAAHGLHGADGP